MYWTWKMFDSVNCNLFRILNNFLKPASWHSIFLHNGYHILRMESDKFDVNFGKVWCFVMLTCWWYKNGLFWAKIDMQQCKMHVYNSFKWCRVACGTVVSCLNLWSGWFDMFWWKMTYFSVAQSWFSPILTRKSWSIVTVCRFPTRFMVFSNALHCYHVWSTIGIWLNFWFVYKI